GLEKSAELLGVAIKITGTHSTDARRQFIGRPRRGGDQAQAFMLIFGLVQCWTMGCGPLTKPAMLSGNSSVSCRALRVPQLSAGPTFEKKISVNLSHLARDRSASSPFP